MRLLHDKVVKLGRYEWNDLPHFIAKVTEGYHFLTKNSEGKLIIRFVDIYRIFELEMLSLSLVRLWMMYQAKENSQLKDHICAAVDPFHMHEDNSYSVAGRKSITECLITTMLSHKEIPYLLVPPQKW